MAEKALCETVFGRRRIGRKLLIWTVAAILIPPSETSFFPTPSFIRLRSGAVDTTRKNAASDTTIASEEEEQLKAASSPKTTEHDSDDEEEVVEETTSKPVWSPGAMFDLKNQIMADIIAEEEDQVEETAPGIVETEHDVSTADDEKESSSKQAWSQSVGFGLHNQVIADISETDDEEEATEEEDEMSETEDEEDTDEAEETDEEEVTDDDEEEEEDRSSRNSQRGGAMVKEAKPRRFQWLAPMETERVAPSASRLITDDEDQPDEEGVEVQITGESVYEVEVEPVSVEEVESVEGTDRPASVETQDTLNSDATPDALAETERFDAENETKVQSQVSEDSLELVSSNNMKEEQKKDVITGPRRATRAVVARRPRSPYESSGIWGPVDDILTLGLARQYSGLKVSRRLRGARKLTAKYTGLHGFLSGKRPVPIPIEEPGENEQMDMIRRRLEAIERAKQRIPEEGSVRGLFGRRTPRVESEYGFAMRRSAKEEAEERRRMERVREIDRLFVEGQQKLFDLACEKDMLQRRPNPLWEYTTGGDILESGKSDNVTAAVSTTRTFNFPPQDLVDEYLEVLFLSSRLVKMNHTDLWKNCDDYDEDDELMDDYAEMSRWKKSPNGNSNGNWWLRNGIGEKIGLAAETAAYKSVCNSLMSVLARSLSSLHGLNVMKFSDVRLSMEQAPDLPPVSAGMIPGSSRNSNYAKKTLQDVMRRGSRKNRKKRKRAARDQEFLQRGAVVETLLSHCQISAPLLQLFPLAWQRALLSNIITLTTAVIGDFCEGVEFRILGHRLSFAFTPITEEDMLRGIMSGGVFNQRQPPQEEFEAAVRATAEELSQELKFLDRWHERALGSGMLRAQIANLIARIVLTIVNDVLRGARMDLWTTQAGGPRLVAGLEYRTGPVGYTGETSASM